MRRSLVLSPLLALFAFHGAAAIAVAQVFHLPPVHRPILPKSDTVLLVRPVGTPLTGAALSVDDERLVLTFPNRAPHVITLANREIRDVVNELLAEYGDSITVATRYPLYSTRYLKPMQQDSLDTAGVSVLANPDQPELNIGFGVVFGLADGGPDEGDKGLLSTTGFQLDLAGSYQVSGPGERQPDSSPQDGYFAVYVQPRFGLAANQQLQVSDNEGAMSATEGQLQDAIEQADQIALGIQADVVLPVAPRLDFVVSPLYTISWTWLADPGFPDIVVAGELKRVEDLFDSTLVVRARRALRQPLPLSEFGVQGVFHFRRNDRPHFYVGGGVMKREVPIPRVSFRREHPDSIPDPLSLRGALDPDYRRVWRAFFGARLAGVLDVRVDAAGPVGPRNSSPLLKVMLGRAFPTSRSEPEN